MKLFLFLFVFVSQLIYAQNMGESVKKYSYLVYIINDNGTPSFAAGFFFKLNKVMYFITAGHVAGMDKNVDEKWPSTINVVLCKQGSLEECTLRINISKVARKKKQTKYYLEPDLYFCKVKGRMRQKINSVEQLVPNFNNFDFTKIESVYLWGYPNGPNSIEEIMAPIDTVLAKGPIIGAYGLKRNVQEIGAVDSMTYWVNTTGTNSSFGDSGSPAFFKIGGKYYFGGLCSEGYKGYNVITIVRPEIIIRKMKRQ